MKAETIDTKEDRSDEEILRKYNSMGGLPVKRFFKTSGVLCREAVVITGFRDEEREEKIPDSTKMSQG